MSDETMRIIRDHLRKTSPRRQHVTDAAWPLLGMSENLRESVEVAHANAGTMIIAASEWQAMAQRQSFLESAVDAALNQRDEALKQADRVTAPRTDPSLSELYRRLDRAESDNAALRARLKAVEADKEPPHKPRPLYRWGHPV